MLLGLLGSGEFEPWSTEPDRVLLDKATSGNGSVAVLPTASAPEGDDVFDDWARRGKEHYDTMGVPSMLVPIKTRHDAMNGGHEALLDDVSMIFFSGGNPAFLAQVLLGTPFWDAVLHRVAAGAALAGCSAGAVFLGEVAPDASVLPPTADVMAQAGMRLLPGLMIGPHWDALDSFFPGLQQMFIDAAPEESVIVGIDENTAAVVENDSWLVFGSGGAHVYHDKKMNGSYRAGESFRLQR